MVSFKVSWHFFILKKYKTQMTPQNPNSPHLIWFLTGYPNQISLDPIVLLYVTPWCHLHCWRRHHPPPHDSSSDDKWWKTHFGSSSSSVVCHSHYCFIVLAQPPVPSASAHLSIQSLKYCSCFSLHSHSPSN